MHKENILQARLASRKGMISLRELQSQTGDELDALLPSVLRPQGGAFSGKFKGDSHLKGDCHLIIARRTNSAR